MSETWRGTLQLHVTNKIIMQEAVRLLVSMTTTQQGRRRRIRGQCLAQKWVGPQEPAGEPRQGEKGEAGQEM